jgi:hypothetical protein
MTKKQTRAEARTDNAGTDSDNGRSRSPSGMTTKKSNGKNKQWFHAMA